MTNTNKKLQLNKSSIMQLTEEHPLTEEQLKKVAGGVPQHCTINNPYTGGCCDDNMPESKCFC